MSTENKEKITVCDVVKYEEDIKPFPLVKIYAGVGSGKSYFAGKMITGSQEYGIPEHHALIITSRRAKVEETLKELGADVKPSITKNGNLSFEAWETGEDRPEKYEKYLRTVKYDNDFGEHEITFYNQSAVCTNAFVSAYLRYVYDEEEPITDIWNKFDVVIIDEVHSLITDSTYQSATFDVLEFVKDFLYRYQNNQIQNRENKHLILMTGTPQPFEDLVNLEFPEECINKRILFDECENVVPKNVILIDELSSKKKILELLENGKKVIYFTNHTLTEREVVKNFNIPASVKVGVSFSKEDKKKSLAQDEKKKIDDIENSLANHSLIPADIQFFVTTSRNKEGINIHNKDYANMFVETHLMYDIVQMAGRVREGVENLYIITNAEQLNSAGSINDILFSKKVMVENKDYVDSSNESNAYLVKEYLENKMEMEKESAMRKRNLMNYVRYIENRFSYVRYNIYKRQFEFFYLKEIAEKMGKTQQDRFMEMLLSDDNTFVKRWFPDYVLVSREESPQEKASLYLNNLMGTKRWERLSIEDFKKHIRIIKELFGSELTSAKRLLHLVDEKFNFERSGSNHYYLYYGDENPKMKKHSMKRMKKKNNSRKKLM